MLHWPQFTTKLVFLVLVIFLSFFFHPKQSIENPPRVKIIKNFVKIIFTQFFIIFTHEGFSVFCLGCKNPTKNQIYLRDIKI